MRIPVTMCHGVSWQPQKVKRKGNLLTAARFETYFALAAELGFASISYDDLAAWRRGEARLPDRPILFDFDHPDWSIGRVVAPIMRRFGYRGNLFVNTSPMEKTHNPYYMKWPELQALVDAGWHLGAHTHRHYGLDYLARKDPSGALIRAELETCDALLRRHLGITPQDFAYTSTTWSAVAEAEVRRRYRFARLWIIGTHYATDRGPVRFADLVGVPGADADDGGPPLGARYITPASDPLRLPAMELEYLIFELDAFRAYLCGALEGEAAPPPESPPPASPPPASVP
jgi:peptidoglycan/xylan/chitin deacetylase (PgdA/CDA1 family)